MSENRIEIKRVLFVNGVRVKIKAGSGATSPTMALLEEIEECCKQGSPWGKFWVERFTARTVVDEKKGGVYVRYDAKMVNENVMLG